MNRWLVAVVAAAGCTLAAAGHHVLARIPVPGDYGWDYASTDTEGRRLYVGHDRDVVVVDLDSGAIAGTITGGPDTTRDPLRSC